MFFSVGSESVSQTDLTLSHIFFMIQVTKSPKSQSFSIALRHKSSVGAESQIVDVKNSPGGCEMIDRLCCSPVSKSPASPPAQGNCFCVRAHLPSSTLRSIGSCSVEQSWSDQKQQCWVCHAHDWGLQCSQASNLELEPCYLSQRAAAQRKTAKLTGCTGAVQNTSSWWHAGHVSLSCFSCRLTLDSRDWTCSHDTYLVKGTRNLTS